MKLFVRLAFLALGLTVFAVPAFAAKTQPQPKAPAAKSLGVFGAWGTYSLQENGQQICYMAARVPLKENKMKRGPVQVTITHRPAESTRDVFSYDAGYAFKQGSDVIIRIGKEDFNLFTQNDTAWTRDNHTDHMLAAAVQKNVHMTVIGNPGAKGAKTVSDIVDLRGAPDAYRMISKTCGVEVPVPAKPAKTLKKPIATAKKKAKSEH